jgi:hypothetical protein
LRLYNTDCTNEKCRRRTRTLRYTKFVHMVPAYALNQVGRCRLTASKLVLKAPWFERLKILKVNYYILLWTFAFNFNLRHYNLAMENAEGDITMEAALHRINEDRRTCDIDVGGCGTMNGMTHALALGSTGSTVTPGAGRAAAAAGGAAGAGPGGGAADGAGGGGRGGGEGGSGAWSGGGWPGGGGCVSGPRAASTAPRRAPPSLFCLALVWESASAWPAEIRRTLSHISPQLDLGLVYDRVPKGTAKYQLLSFMCYYGEHYVCFALSNASGGGGGGRGGGSGGGSGVGGGWVMFDDATAKNVGEWLDVVAVCEKWRLQPCVLFYQKEGAAGHVLSEQEENALSEPVEPRQGRVSEGPPPLPSSGGMGPMVGRCRLTVSKPELKARLVSAISAWN